MTPQDLTDAINDSIADATDASEGRPRAEHLLAALERRGLRVVAAETVVVAERAREMRAATNAYVEILEEEPQQADWPDRWYAAEVLEMRTTRELDEAMAASAKVGVRC